MAVYTESPLHIQRIDVPSPQNPGVDFDLYENTHTVIIVYWGHGGGGSPLPLALRQARPGTTPVSSYLISPNTTLILEVGVATSTAGYRRLNLSNAVAGKTPYLNVIQVVKVIT